MAEERDATELDADALAGMRADYRLVFLGSAEGRRVLRDILENGCLWRAKLYEEGMGAYDSAHRVGRHYVGQLIHERLYLSDDEILALAEARPMPQVEGDTDGEATDD